MCQQLFNFNFSEVAFDLSPFPYIIIIHLVSGWVKYFLSWFFLHVFGFFLSLQYYYTRANRLGQ